MSWGLGKGAANAGAPMSGKAARLGKGGTAVNKATRGSSRPGKPAGAHKDPKGPPK